MPPRNRVLVLDGQVERRRALCSLLRRGGYDADDTEALQAIDSTDPDGLLAVLISAESLRRDHRSARRTLRQHAPGAALIVTAPDDDGAMLNALQCPADGYLLETPRPDDLFHTLNAIAKRGNSGPASSGGTGFHGVFESAASGVLLLDRANRVVAANRTATQWLGHEPGGLHNREPSEIIHPHDLPAMVRIYKNVAAGEAGPCGLRARLIDAAGEPIAARLTLTAGPDSDAAPHRVAALIDAPPLRRAAQPVRRELDTIRNASHEALIRIDPAGTIIGCNDAAERLYDYPTEQLLGQSLATLLPDEQRDQLPRTLARLRAGQRLEQPKTTHLNRKQQPLRLDVRYNPVRDAAGRTVAGFVVAQDQTRIHHLEQQLLEASTSEQQRIGQDLHDGLGQELTGIAFLIRSLRDELQNAGQTRHAENANQIIGYINDAITHAKALVKGLRPTELEGGGLVRALRNLTEAASRTHRIECELDADEAIELPPPDTALHLYYIAREAVNNAIHHGRAERVRLQLEMNHDRLHLRICDDGIGLPANGLENHGSGLDIMNCRARMIGGSLHVRREAENGTEVACHVDLAASTASPSEP